MDIDPVIDFDDDGKMHDNEDDMEYSGEALGETIGTPKEFSARQEFNLCPLCWMPLFIDKSNTEDAHWCSVQYVFKGKPAFSIKASGSKRERPIYVFGLSELDRKASSTLMVSCEDCHFIHTSTNRMSVVIGSWDKVGEVKKIQPDNRTGNDDSLDFFKNLNITRGIWTGGVFELFPELPEGGGTMKQRMENFGGNDVFKLMSRTFSGCPDCNSKMTINKYIAFLFKLLIPPEKLRTELPARGAPGVARGRGARGGGSISAPRRRNFVGTFDPETQMYYIILSGMIDDRKGNLKRDDTNSFWVYPIPDEDHRDSWSYRYVILWCLLQILFSLWEDSTIKKQFRHHVSYLYSGIQDFYLSLLFFCMHCTRFSALTNPVAASVTFEIFHFYYSSHLPFFLINRGLARGRSLSECVLGDDLSQFRCVPQMGSREVGGQFVDLKQRVLAFWQVHVRCLSNFIIDPEALGAADYRAYFCMPSTAVSIRNGCMELELSVKSFCNYFTGNPGYWFHFKYITMMKIERECEKYHSSQGITLARRVWDEWYNYLCQHIALLGTSPPVRAHLSAVLREMGGGPGRWRTRVL